MSLHTVSTPAGVWDTDCTRCPLSACRANHFPLYGDGASDAEYLIVSMAPTLLDASDAVLFTGEAGDLLMALLNAVGINPENTFRTTLVGCPSYIMIPATEESEERISYQKPKAEYIKSCLPRLYEVIYRVDPKIIITFGVDPWTTLVSTKDRNNRKKISEGAGELYDCWVPGRVRPTRYPVMACLALEDIIKNPSKAEHAPIATTVRALRRACLFTNTINQENR